ncbi:MAG: hypothetical protein HY074_05245 [Deltaproteobacteria bacterium]|nr:hypothetical protein [Deltaproteobacteria bacterium]
MRWNFALILFWVAALGFPAAQAAGLTVRPNGFYVGLAGASAHGELTLNFMHRFSSKAKLSLGAGLDESRMPLGQGGLAFAPTYWLIKPFGGAIALMPTVGGVVGYRTIGYWGMLTVGLGMFGERLYFELGGAVSTMSGSRMRSYINLGWFF